MLTLVYVLRNMNDCTKYQSEKTERKRERSCRNAKSRIDRDFFQVQRGCWKIDPTADIPRQHRDTVAATSTA